MRRWGWSNDFGGTEAWGRTWRAIIEGETDFQDIGRQQRTRGKTELVSNQRATKATTGT